MRRRRASLRTLADIELADIEAAFTALRAAPADLAGAVAAGFAAAGLAGRGTAYEAALRLAERVGANDPAPPLPYHGLHHFAETVRAMGMLCGSAIAMGLIPAALAGLGLVAMVGHDWGHDGTPGGDGRLEAMAASRVRAALDGLADDAQAVLHSVILGTDPSQLDGNTARGNGSLPPGPLGLEVDRLCRLANEADVFASLLPELGWQQGEALAVEWYPHPRAAEVATFVGRLAFLRLYDGFSSAATAIGLAGLARDQVAAFARVAVTLGAAEDAAAGAAMLDAMAQPAARALYVSQLGKN